MCISATQYFVALHEIYPAERVEKGGIVGIAFERFADLFEGVVEMFALGDTTGAVAEVHLAGGTHDPLLERLELPACEACEQATARIHVSNEARLLCPGCAAKG